MNNSQKGFSVPLLIIIVVLVIGSGVYLYSKRPTTIPDYPAPSKASIDSKSSIPQNYSDCVSTMGSTNYKLACEYTFEVDIESSVELCNKIGRMLPPSPPSHPTCRISFINPQAKFPTNYEECLNVTGYDYAFVDNKQQPISLNGKTRYCQVYLQNYKPVVNPDAEKTLINQCLSLNRSDSVNIDEYDSSCGAQFLK